MSETALEHKARCPHGASMQEHVNRTCSPRKDGRVECCERRRYSCDCGTWWPEKIRMYIRPSPFDADGKEERIL